MSGKDDILGMSEPGFVARMKDAWSRRGAFDQTPSPRSVSLLRRNYEPKDQDPRAQDDSVVYSESKSARSGARLRPQRRGESFSIRSTSKRPTSWHPSDASPTKRDAAAALGSPLSPLRDAKSNAETSKSKRSPKSPTALTASSSMQFGAPSSSDSLSMASYSSFQSLQNLGPAKSTSSMGPVGPGPVPQMSSSVSWHGTGSASQPALNKPLHQPPPVEPRRKLHNSGSSFSSQGNLPTGHEPCIRSRTRGGAYPENENNSGGFLSYSQSQSQLPTYTSNSRLPPSVPPAHSMQDIRQRHGKKEHSHGSWSRPTPYKPNNYENIETFEAAKSNAAANLSHASLVQAQAYSHSYTNFSKSKSISEEGFNHGDGPRTEPPEIPPWPHIDHSKMLSEDSGVELSMTSPPPPLPPDRDDSRGHHLLRTSHSQERLASWPSSAYQQYDEEDKSRSGPRAHSWSTYQPRFNAHLEEKPENKHMKNSQHAVIGNGDSDIKTGYGVDTKGDVELKNLYNAKPLYPGYGYETNYDMFHASKEPVQKETSAVDDLFEYTNQNRDLSGKSVSATQSSTSPPPPLPQTAPPLPKTAPPSPLTSPPLPQTAPPLPQTAPPPMPHKTRSGSSSGHTIIVRQKPFYNTGTQTEISPPQQALPTQCFLGPPIAASRSTQLSQATPAEPAFRNVEIQVNMDLIMVTPMVTPMSTLERKKYKKADQGCQVQPSMLPETLNNSLMNTGLAQPQDNYAEVNSFHRTAPIVDKMTQENRIPETIREESPKKYENASTAQGMCSPTQEVKDSILQSIHDHSPSQTSLMRKLSREFFGNQMKPSYSSHPSLLTVPETQRRRSADPPLLKQSKEYWSPGDNDNNKTVTNKPPTSEPAKDVEGQKDGKKKLDRSKKLSLRKAFGIFDEIETVDDPNSRHHLSSHGKSMSASHIATGRNHQLYPEVKEESTEDSRPLRWYNRPKGDEVHKEALHQRYDSGHFSQEESNSSNKGGQKVTDGHIKKLQRTTSEQIRPVKERIAERERNILEQTKNSEADLRDRRHKLSDPTQRHKNSDPSEYQGKAGANQVTGHRASDPSMEEYRKASTSQHRLSDPASSQREKRLSGDSDLFRGSYDSSAFQRRPGSVRSTSSSSLDGHRMSDPELKKMQHMAVLNFFEMKTGKRLSSSSMDSSGNSKYNSLSSRGSSSIDSAVGLYRERSPSPQKSPEEPNFTQDHAFAALKKSKSLPRDMAGHTEDGLGLSLPPEPAPSIDSRPGSASSRERRRSGSRWEHKKEKSAPSQMESYQMAPQDSTSPASTEPTHQGPPGKETRIPEAQLSPGGSTSPERVDTSEPLDSTNQVLPKQTYDYSSSSSGSSSPTKSPATSEFSHKYSYQVTTNKSYADSDGSPPPPVLPPRNYRPSPTSGATGQTTEHKFRPPPTPPQTSPHSSAASPLQSDMMGTDYNTPQPNDYANQLRQQMRKQFSQTGVGATRLQSKPLTEVKQSVAMSRPVDRPPAPQEAVAPPQPLPRSTTLPELSISSDGFGYPDGTKSAREPRETKTHKIDVIHISTGSLPHQQPQQQHHSHQHQQHHQHHHHSQLHHSHHHHPPMNSQPQNHQAHHNAHPMQPSHSLTNISSSSSSTSFHSPGSTKPIPAPRGSPKPAPRDRGSLSRLPPSERPLPVVDQNRNSPKQRHPAEAPSIAEVLASVAPPTEGDPDETLEKLPLPPATPPPPEEEEEETRRRLSFDEEADVCTTTVSSQRYSNESYMTKRNNPRQGFNGNYRRSNSNEIPKLSGPGTPPAVTSTSSPQLLITTGSTSSSGGHMSGAPSSPPASTPPPKSETLVKVATVMTVNKSLPTAESKTQLEPGPVRTPSSGGNIPPPVPPKYNRGMTVTKQHPATSSLSTTTPERAKPESEGHLGKLESTPPEFILSGRPGVTNLDEASSLLNQLNSSRGGATGSSPSGTSPHSSNSALASWTSKVTTPTTSSSVLIKSRDRFTNPPTSSESHHGVNGHSDTVSGHPTVSVHSRSSSFQSSPDSPPSLPSCPPPDHPPSLKEIDSHEEKEQAEEKLVQEGKDKEDQSEQKDSDSVEKTAEGVSPLGCPIHVRQKSQEEIDCEKAAAVVAIQIVDDDKQLSDVILPPPEHKMTTDYMSGLFDTSVADLPAMPILVGGRSPGSHNDENKENRRSLQTSPPPVGSWSPPSVASLQNKMREEGVQREEIFREMGVPDTSLQRQKEELEARIKQKLDILKSEKDALKEEILNNELLGKEVTAVVEKKVHNKGEFDKFKLYVDELDKVMYLLLKLSGRLARAENAVMSLPPDADEKDKMLLNMKRDEASEKHADAKLLKQGIDRRSQQVSSCLLRNLTGEEFNSYQYYIKMKSKLTMEQQDIDDKIKLGDEQLRALKRSMQR